MAYTSMKKLIQNANLKRSNGEMTEEEYAAFKASSMNKLDVFLTCERMGQSQYLELVEMMEA